MTVQGVANHPGQPGHDAVRRSPGGPVTTCTAGRLEPRRLTEKFARPGTPQLSDVTAARHRLPKSLGRDGGEVPTNMTALSAPLRTWNWAGPRLQRARHALQGGRTS